MFRQNPITDSSLAYLREAHPHRRWHFVVLLIALSIGSIFIWRGYTIDNLSTIYTMAGIIVPTYWYFQFRIMQSANKLQYHSWQSEIPAELVGTISNRRIMYAKVRAILTHHRVFIGIISLALLGLSLMLTGHLEYYVMGRTSSQKRGIFQFVGVMTTAYPSPWDGIYPSGLPDFTLVLYMGIMMIAQLFISTVNSILSISISLSNYNMQRGLSTLFTILFIAVLILSALFTIRNTAIMECNRSRMNPALCPSAKITLVRLVDSAQDIALAFIDGGIGMVSGLHGCGLIKFGFRGYQARHLLSIIVTVFTQLGLSYLLLERASLSSKKKKT